MTEENQPSEDDGLTGPDTDHGIGGDLGPETDDTLLGVDTEPEWRDHDPERAGGIGAPDTDRES